MSGTWGCPHEVNNIRIRSSINGVRLWLQLHKFRLEIPVS